MIRPFTFPAEIYGIRGANLYCHVRSSWWYPQHVIVQQRTSQGGGHGGEPVEGWDQISIKSKREGAIMEGWAFWAAHWTGSCKPRKDAVSIGITIRWETRWFLPSNTIVKRARKKNEVRICLNSTVVHSLADMIENLQRYSAKTCCYATQPVVKMENLTFK